MDDDQIDKIAKWMLEAFAAKMQRDGVDIEEATHAAIVFAAHAAAGTVCLRSTDHDERIAGLEVFLTTFSEHALRCIRENSPEIN